MNASEATSDDGSGLFEWTVASLKMPGESVCGDAPIVSRGPSGTLFAVVDGLGHGVEAHQAACMATAEFARWASEDLGETFTRSHQALSRTRGAVASAAFVSARTGVMRWLGVGNVEGVLVRAGLTGQLARERLLLRGGVLGQRLPRLAVTSLPLRRFDTLVFATDGLRDGFANDIDPRLTPPQLAEQLLAVHARGDDDALVLVARYWGSAA